jgi:hypothetical protein
MIRQDDERLIHQYHRGGCYVFSILWFVNMVKNFPFSAELLNELHATLIKHGWMEDDCTVLRPESIYGYFDIGAKIVWDKNSQHKQPPSRICHPNQVECLEWYNPSTGHGHFTAGNGLGMVTYDPLGKSNTVEHGYLVSKRIFTLS